jgi:hypothetical protein
MARQAAQFLGPRIRGQHQHVPILEADKVHLGTEEHAMLAVPDRVVDNEERRGTAMAVAFRPLAVERLGALLKPLLGCGKRAM